MKALREPLIAEEADWRPDLNLTATLPARALHHLFGHGFEGLEAVDAAARLKVRCQRERPQTVVASIDGRADLSDQR